MAPTRAGRATHRSGMMRIHVNGDDRTIQEGSTVGDLLRELDIRNDQVAVEVNLNIVDRAQFEHHRLQEDDCIEILSFIGGGSPNVVSRH